LASIAINPFHEEDLTMMRFLVAGVCFFGALAMTPRANAQFGCCQQSFALQGTFFQERLVPRLTFERQLEARPFFFGGFSGGCSTGFSTGCGSSFGLSAGGFRGGRERTSIRIRERSRR
jgi:hypothetical protein